MRLSLRSSASAPYARALALLAAAAAPLCAAPDNRPSDEYPDFYGAAADAKKGAGFTPALTVLAPSVCSNVKGDVTVVFRAPGMTRTQAYCWRQPTADQPDVFGHDALLADLALGADGGGSFVFRADEFPNGPTTLRLYAQGADGRRDLFELQLFNLGGERWRQGLPTADPPGAKGMRLVFADDFDGPLSVSPDGRGARYAAHKTGGGDFSGWPFSDPLAENEPFGQQGTFLRFHASKPLGTKGRSGLLSSLRADGTGVCVPLPSYFECRFVAHSAPGTWPAFWTLTQGTIGLDPADPGLEAATRQGTDELDVIEAYGGFGPKNPSAGGRYSATAHFWKQPKPAWLDPKSPDGGANPLYRPHSFRADTLALGGHSAWSWTFHTYGLAVTESETVYYFDDIEVGRHPTGPTSQAQPAWFLINYAIGGISGWPIDLERYGNQSDMWVDYVRVYSGRAQAPRIDVAGFVGAAPARVALACATEGAALRYTTDGSEPGPGSTLYTGPFEVREACRVAAVAVADGLAPSLTARAAVTAPPGVAGSIGVNFVAADDAEQRLGPNEVAGLGREAQANWNHAAIGGAPAASLKTADGAVASGVALSLAGAAQAGRGEPWGFAGSALKLQRGSLQPSPEITVTGVPYPAYDVLVYLAAGVHAGKGRVAIAKPAGARGAVDPAGAYAYDYTWLSGKYAEAASSSEARPANVVRFTGNTADAFVLRLEAASGGWTGVAALQIVPRR
jgi:hypothetical protein